MHIEKQNSINLSTSSDEEIQHIWILHLNREHEAVTNRFSKIIAKYFNSRSLPLNSNILIEYAPKLKVQNLVSLLSLKCAILRTAGLVKKSDESLDSLIELLKYFGTIEYFDYYRETSQRAFNAGNIQASYF